MKQLLLQGLTVTSVASILFSITPMPSKGHDANQAEKLGVKIEELTKSSKEWNGQDLPQYPRGIPEIKVLRIEIPAGVKLPRHTHPVINAAVILKGSLELKLMDGTRRIFQAGEALIEVVDTVHSGRALDNEDVDLIVFYAGIQGTPTTIFVKKP